MILMMVLTLLLGAAVIISTATAAGLAPSVIAQQQEQASLGEEQEESLADSIVSNVLDDHNIEVVDQDNSAEQVAANVGVQDQDSTQEEELAQEAANKNVDFDVSVGGLQQSLPSTPPPDEEQPPTQSPGPIGPPGPPPPPPLPGCVEPPIEFPRENGKIAFSSNREDGSTHQIYVMNADGSEQTRLTGTSDNTFPSWSPDCKKIVFVSVRDQNDEIYVMNADGSEQTRLTRSPAYDTTPSWSPDGTKIVFSSGGEIFVMNADGSGKTNITNNPRGFDWVPDWGPAADTDP